ncbi:MAG: hypothetical protein ACI9MR_003319, partial [Myxococcota bacterium]
MRSSVTFRLLFTFLLLAATAAPAAAVDVTRVSSPVLYIDSPFALSGMYAAYRIENNDGVDYADLFVTIGGFAGPEIGLAPLEDGVDHLGPLADGVSKVAYFYLASGSATDAEDHTVSVTVGSPAGASAGSAVFAMTAEETIKAQANKVTLVTHTPDGPVIGGRVVMTVTGDTGTIGNSSVFAYTPATGLDWPANAFALEAVTHTMTGGNAAVVNEALIYNAPNTSDTHYVTEYVFRIVSFTNAVTIVSPVSHIASGQKMKHTATDTTTYLNLNPIPPTSGLSVLLTRSPTSLLVSPGGDRVTHTLTLTNTGDETITTDQLVDGWQSALTAPTYVAGSTRLNGQASTIEATTTASGFSWNVLLDVPAQGSASLSFDVDYPAVVGAYDHGAYALIGTAAQGVRVDSTVDPEDQAPAVANLWVGDLPANGPPAGTVPDVWVITGTPEVAIDVATLFVDPDGDQIVSTSVAVTTEPSGATVSDPSNGAADGALLLVADDPDAATS